MVAIIRVNSEGFPPVFRAMVTARAGSGFRVFWRSHASRANGAEEQRARPSSCSNTVDIQRRKAVFDASFWRGAQRRSRRRRFELDELSRIVAGNNYVPLVVRRARTLSYGRNKVFDQLNRIN